MGKNAEIELYIYIYIQIISMNISKVLIYVFRYIFTD